MSSVSAMCNFMHLTIAAAAQAVRCGELVIFPTETFFGIGGDALNPLVAEKIFTVKKRSPNHPLPLIIPSPDAVSLVAAHVSPLARKLIQRFWPGPLTILFPAVSSLPALLVNQAGEVAARFSPHPVASALCVACGTPLIASSANVSGVPPVTRADALEPLLVKASAGVLAEGIEPSGGLPSTVVRLEQQKEVEGVRIVRPGQVSDVVLKKAGFRVF